MKTFILIIAAAASSGIVNPIEAVHEDMLKQHNDFRKKHNANDLSIDDEVSCCNRLPGPGPFFRILFIPAAYAQRTSMGRPTGGHQFILSLPEF